MSSSRRAASNFKDAVSLRSGTIPLKLPILSPGPLSGPTVSTCPHPAYAYEDESAYAETSADGAARYQRPQPQCIPIYVSQTPLRATTGPPARFPTPQAFCRSFSATATASARRPLGSFNARAPITAEALEKAKAKWFRIKLRYSGEIGWKTPVEMASGDSERNWKERVAFLPRWLGTDGDRELVCRSVFRHTLTAAYDTLMVLLPKIANTSEEERLHLSDQLSAIIYAVVDSTEPSADPNGVQPPPVLPADAMAFRIICKTIALVQIELQWTDGEILEVFRELRKRFHHLTLPQYHSIIASAGQHERDELLLALFAEAQQDWDGATDEWMLYARARALSRLGRASHVLNRYWTEYDTCKAAPPAAYGRHAGLTGGLRKMRPPRYLFIFLLRHQIAAAAKSTAGQSFGHTKELLKAMSANGYEPDSTVYLALLGSSPSLRHRLPEIFESEQDTKEIQDEHIDTEKKSLFLRLLRLRVQESSVRNVFRLLDLSNIERTGMKRAGERTPVFPSHVPPIEEQIEAHVLVSHMFGRLGLPEAARFHFDACWRLSKQQQPHRWAEIAASSVVQGYNVAGKPEKGLAFGLDLLAAKDQAGKNVKAMAAGARLYGALLYSTAALSSLQAAISSTRDILGRLLRERISQDHHIRSGLCALFYTAIGTGSDDVEDLKLLLQELSRLAIMTREPILVSMPKPRDQGVWKPIHGHRLGRILLHLKGQGFEDLLHWRSFKGRSWRAVRAHRLARARQRKMAAQLHKLSQGFGLSRQTRFSPARARRRRFFAARARRAKHLAATLRKEKALAGPLLQETTPRARRRKLFAARARKARHLAARPPSHEQNDFAPPSDETVNLSGPLAVNRSGSGWLYDLHYSQQGPLQSARDMKDGIDLNEYLTPAGYALRLKALSVIRRDHVAAARVYRTMLRHRVQPSMLHIAPIVEGLCLDGRVSEAQSVADAARKIMGQETTARIEGALISGLIRAGKFAAAHMQYRSWTAAGGQPNAYLQHLFKDDERPRLIEEDVLRSALRDAEMRKIPLDLREVDDAFRFLLRESKFVSAHRLVLAAVQWTGMKSDYSLRLAVRASGNYIRKSLLRRGEIVSEEEDEQQAGEIKEGKTQEESDEVLLPRSTIFFPTTHDEAAKAFPTQKTAQEIQSLRLALSLNKRLRQLLHVPSDVEGLARRTALARFREELHQLIIDVARGDYSPSMQRRAARRAALREYRRQCAIARHTRSGGGKEEEEEEVKTETLGRGEGLDAGVVRLA